MEDAYQHYKGQVNFIWVYSSEAHPEEHPFQEGSETKDLGWTHTYSITKEMSERAERAKWLKTDEEPDLTIPMMIDYINDPPNQDNAIKTAYDGGGFYSGYVIDCDGKILVREPWAWYDDGGEWWSLPLAHIDTLYSTLDDYLSNPPDCYDASGGDSDTDIDTDSDTDGNNNSSGDSSGGCQLINGRGSNSISSLLDLFIKML